MFLQIPEDCVNTANRWFDGLMNRDMDVSNEIYSVRTVEFDRQVCMLTFLIYLVHIHSTSFCSSIHVFFNRNCGNLYVKYTLSKRKSLLRKLKAMTKIF